MGCMNGRCSESSTDSDEGQLISSRPRPGGGNSINSQYSVSQLPASPSVDHARPFGEVDGTYGDDRHFDQSAGGTKRRELDQQHMVNSSSEHKTGNHYATHNGHRPPNGMTPHAFNQHPVTVSDVKTVRGKEIYFNLKKSYEWKDRYDHPSQEFLGLMDRLFMECQLHLTALSTRGTVEFRREADMIVQEMVSVRNHWGAELLPNSICNAFVRERIPITLGTTTQPRQFRIDCAQFFEPVPFYGSNQQAGNPGELMKLYRFSVYDLQRNEVILRYYLERSNVTQLYHVLCFTCESYRGQVHPYGTEQPSYWDIRHKMLEDVNSRLMSALSPGSHPPPQPHVATIYPPSQGDGSVIIQVPTRN